MRICIILFGFDQTSGCFAGIRLPSPRRFLSRLRYFASGGVCELGIGAFGCFLAPAWKKRIVFRSALCGASSGRATGFPTGEIRQAARGVFLVQTKQVNQHTNFETRRCKDELCI